MHALQHARDLRQPLEYLKAASIGVSHGVVEARELMPVLTVRRKALRTNYASKQHMNPLCCIVLFLSSTS